MIDVLFAASDIAVHSSGEIALCGLGSPTAVFVVVLAGIIWKLLKASMKNEEALQSRGQTAVSRETVQNAEPETFEGETWTCTCGTENPIEVNNCRSCHKYKIKQNSWS